MPSYSSGKEWSGGLRRKGIHPLELSIFGLSEYLVTAILNWADMI
jgi:hypothetical protein